MVLYAVPCVPFDSELVVILTAGTLDAIDMLRAFVAVCAVSKVESVTSTVKVKVPDAVGVPEMTPVEAVKLNPAGKEPELMLQL